MSAGSYFGKYFLMKRLAQGGMGEIYIARQSGPGGFSKTVALKKVLPHLTDNKEFIQGFLGEAALAAKMTHRNIVSVFDFGLDEDSNSYYLTMEYVSGKALNQILEECVKRKERMPLSLIKDVSVQMCEGMSYAHNLTDDMGQPLILVHRDLNPSNLLVSYNGDVKIIDWGIAKSEMSQVKTEAGMIKGKFVYMSPEQSMAKKLDKRSDVFAAGITIYEMLTGENPFHKPNVVLSLEAIQRLDPPPPSEFDPALAGFDPIVAKALAKDLNKRYQDCADIAEDLKNVMVPPAGERMGQFVGRLFRSSLEEEQKLMQETGAAKLPPRSVPGARIPSSPGARVPQVPMQQPDEERGGTLVMGGNDVSQEELRRQMDAAKQKLLAQQQAQQASRRQQQQHHQEQEQEPAQRTMFIGAADLQPPPPRSSKAPIFIGVGVGLVLAFVGVGAFFFLTKHSPEPTPAIAEVKTVPVPDTTKVVPPPPSDTVAGDGRPPDVRPPDTVTAKTPDTRNGPAGSGGTGFANGSGGLKPDSPKMNGANPGSGPGTTKTPEPKVVVQVAPPNPTGKGSLTQKPPSPPPEPIKPVVVASKGGLLLRAMPSMPVKLDGKGLDASAKIDLKKDTGTFAIGDESSPLKISITYKISGDSLQAEVSTEPWSILAVNDGTKGKTPQTIDVSAGLLKLEFKRPGMDAPPRLMMKFSKE